MYFGFVNIFYQNFLKKIVKLFFRELFKNNSIIVLEIITFYIEIFS